MSDSNKQGMLYLCATPIGNLSDITERVLETLKSVDLIAAEDTRNSIRLLNHFDIKVPLVSYHEHNKYDRAKELIEKMRRGADIALITDAGTPVISDPGEVITNMCHEAAITVTSLPGPCALITALSLSGLDARRFVFEGFLPPDKKERKKVLERLSDETRTIILYEAPHHLQSTLRELAEALCNRQVAVCRELTKKFEEVKRMTLFEAKEYYEQNEPRGEYVLVLSGRSEEELDNERIEQYREKDINEHMAEYEQKGLDHKEAMKQVAKDRGVSRREIYKMLLEEK
ncbi:MAG: 16S rRNA (cytidine(1402)-2'-O)-methyltransferase [Lachnospiraceae bacterium]|nr:16S rRNA (cytidine(1402)-2'-O)-methyltransferase [Lachnospiraceae bacterium]